MPSIEHQIAVADFARGLSSLISAGVQLGVALRAVEANTSNPQLADVIRDVQSRVETSDSLSQAMANHTDWFSAVAVYLIRAGEVAGVLDETLVAWGDMIDRDLDLRDKLQFYRAMARLAQAASARPLSTWEQEIEATLGKVQPRVNVSLFLYGFGVMVGAGVPMTRALAEAAAALDGDAARAVQEIAADLPWNGGGKLHERLADLPGMTPVAVELLHVGEDATMLDSMCIKAAEVLRAETERELRGTMDACLTIDPEEA